MFKQGFTCPALLFDVPSRILFEYGVITLYDRPFHTVPLRIQDFMTHWAVPVSLATTQGISVDFFSSGYLDVSVPRVRLLHLLYSVQNTAYAVGFPIRTPPDQSLLPAPRSLSQATTSFIASCRLGIHHVRLIHLTI